MQDFHCCVVRRYTSEGSSGQISPFGPHEEGPFRHSVAGDSAASIAQSMSSKEVRLLVFCCMRSPCVAVTVGAWLCIGDACPPATKNVQPLHLCILRSLFHALHIVVSLASPLYTAFRELREH
eukprot:1138179-Pelagomonas_calceolata.AAC.2